MSKLSTIVLSLIASLAGTRDQPLVDEAEGQGALLAIGGGVDPQLVELFVELAGGPEARIVVIPTAAGATSYPPDGSDVKQMRSLGAAEVTLLHTNDPVEADTEEFCAPLRAATGVWFGGGRQWRLVDSYLGTLAQHEIEAVYLRGGVIAGSSAGATIQGSYLARGDTRTNMIMMGDHEEGFGLIPEVAIDQHLLARNRQFDLIEIIEAHPELLGIGIDEDTGILVRGDELEVVGRSYVAIYDHERTTPSGGRFYLLRAGDRLDLETRVPMRNGRRLQDVVERSWDAK